MKPGLGRRVWLAYNCLPRDSHGNLPSYASIERDYSLPATIVSKLINGTRAGASTETLFALANALRVKPEWLTWEVGDAPVPDRPLPPQPTEKRARVSDSGEMTRLSVNTEAARRVLAAVDRALLESPPDAAEHQILARAMILLDEKPQVEKIVTSHTGEGRRRVS